MELIIKKTLIIFSFLVITVSLFVSCSVNSSVDNISTTAVTDEQGTTHYYQPLAENGSTSTYVEIVTDKKGNAVIKKNGTYVTKEHTTILTTNTTDLKTAKSSKVTTNSTTLSDKSNAADNVVDFETTATKQNQSITTIKSTTTTTITSTTTTKPTEKETTSTTQTTTKVVTDKDGWIEKWY